MRDVLVASKKPGRDEEAVESVRRFFDAVLVHGDPALIPFGATFAAAEQIADLIRYTGYVAAAADERDVDRGKGRGARLGRRRRGRRAAALRRAGGAPADAARRHTSGAS